MDSRFVHIGQGLWGLRKWVPKRAEARSFTLLPMGSRRVYDDEEDLRNDDIDLNNDEGDRNNNEDEWGTDG